MSEKPKILALMGSPRNDSNTEILLDHFLDGARAEGADIVKHRVSDLGLEPCSGCLRCNVLGLCANKKDDWQDFAFSWKEAHGVVLASPVYFHNVTAQTKIVIDRFRSFLHLEMKEDSYEYGPLPYEPKHAALIFVQGQPSSDDYLGAEAGVRFFLEKMCGGTILPTFVGKALGVRAQVDRTEDELGELGEKLGWSEEHPARLVEYYEKLKASAANLGRELARTCMS